MTARTAHRPPLRRDAERSVFWICIFVVALIWFLPFVFMIFTSLKLNSDVFDNPAYLPPANPAWENFPDAIRRGNLITAGLNSLLIAVVKVPIGLLVSSLCAFGIARLRFPFHRLLLAIIVVGALVPIQVAIAPLFRIILNLGLLDNPIGVILPYIGFGIPFQVLILWGFFSAIPRELDEAARMDGASNWQLYRRVSMPLALPALAALFVLDFVATWNEFAIALTILHSQSSYTVPLALQSYNSQFSTAYGQLNAAIVLSVLPVLVVFLRFQKYFVSGTFSGSIKG